MYKTNGGTIWATPEEAAEAETKEHVLEVLEGLDMYWRDTSAATVADSLLEAGYTIVKR